MADQAAPEVPRCTEIPEVIRDLRAGAPGVLLVVPGWLGSGELRKPVLARVRYAAASRWAPVHARWAWLREDEDGHAETAFWIWPCLTDHQPGLQCRDGRVFHGNAR
jgi:hypothetical protein